MRNKKIHIQGMHCKSCEILLENEILKVSGVKGVEANYRKGVAEIKYASADLDEKSLEEAVRIAGYSLGEKKLPWLSKSPNDYKDLLIAAAVLALLFLAMKFFKMENFNFNLSSNPSELSAILLIGLAAGFSTCMALVGGLILGISARHAEKHPESVPIERFRPHLFFNSGRIVGFSILGGLLGILGSIFQISVIFSGYLTIFAGIIMFVLGLQLLEVFPRLNNFKITLPKGIARAMGIKKEQNDYSHYGTFVAGALTFFLPCGFTQAMQLLAVESGSFLFGALIMGVFALGTTPGLSSIGGLTSVVKGIFAKRFFKFAGIVVILLAFFNITNGYRLIGLGASNGVEKDDEITKSEIEIINDSNVIIEDGVQIVKMVEKTHGYSPNKFTIKKGIPVKWVIDAQDSYSCAASLVVPKIKVQKVLKAGENIIEFTPTESGKIPFSCSMGMYSGFFTVTE